MVRVVQLMTNLVSKFKKEGVPLSQKIEEENSSDNKPEEELRL